MKTFIAPLSILPICAATIVAACSQVPQELPETRAVGQMLRGAQAPTGEAFISFDVLLTEANNGPAVSCKNGKLDVKIEVSSNGGKTYKKVSTDTLDIACEDSAAPDIALVVDNSGSEKGHLDALRKASGELAKTIQAAGGRMSLVRVSTEATVMQPLTEDGDAIAASLPEMNVNHGWTALYDGIRMGNETLGAAMVAEDAAETTDVASFCQTQPRRGIVVFTDGNENNSSNEHASEDYPGDGINTTFDDLGNLKVRGVTTPIYSVGLGKEVDEAGLHALSERSGGKHHQIDSADALSSIFANIAGYSGPRLHVCGPLPTNKCGRLDVRLSYGWKGETKLEGTQQSTINVDCGTTPPAQARTATVLMSLTDSGIKAKDGASIAAQTVAWVSPVDEPKVLVILDDNHHGEAPKDTAFIVDSLHAAGYEVDFRDEPEFGMDLSEFDGYDVVWFSNPGYPMDDELTFSALKQAASNDIGVVLQGDDMTYSWGNSFDMSELTHLVSLGNGTDACGLPIDNDGGQGFYNVSLENQKEFWGGMSGKTFSYGDDIDYSLAKGNGESVLAWATVRDSKGKAPKCDLRTPVVVAYDPALAK